MKSRLPEVDQYITDAPEYARPILKRLRKLFHQASSKIEETIKWNAPHFEYMGIVGMMAAFKQHVAFGFWKAKLMSDPHGLMSEGTATPFGCKVKSIDELPDDEILLEYIRQAISLNEQGVKVPKPAVKKAARPKVPDDLREALATNTKARETFENFPPSHQREYIEWLTSAKKEETRLRRLAKTLEQLAEGKPHNWKYMAKKQSD